MEEILGVLAYGAGALCLGAALILGFLFALGAKYGGGELEGCLGKIIVSGIIILAGFFFVLAVGAL